MDKTTIAPAPFTPETADVDAGGHEATAAPRSLADWELVMVGGGETTPDW